MTKRFIGGAWPYANGSLHLGHIAGLIGGDILARYFRLKGEEVLYVSGSDCHGTPISVRASEEGISPKEIVDRYHEEFQRCFKQLGFTYDIYTRTDDAHHHEFVQKIFKKLYEKGVIYSKKTEQVYCNSCNIFLPDRYVEGLCPNCGNIARGDQCDFCSSLLEAAELEHRKCKLCGSTPEFRETEHLFFNLPRFQRAVEELVEGASNWRHNAISLSKRYLKEGLVERAVTRDLPWGVSVPIEGFQDKKVYVWIEAVSGYMSASEKWAKEKALDWKSFWEDGVKSYFIHGKDNIPFHSIILPALLMSLGENLHLPDYIISSEYLTIEGKKLSTSRNWAIWIPYMLERYHSDSIRYFLVINGPEKRDSDFSWREFVTRHNSELLGGYGNFVNRTLSFIEKSFNGIIPRGAIAKEVEDSIISTYEKVGYSIEQGDFKKALEEAFSLVRFGNKYFDENTPWSKYKESIEECENTLYNCVQIIANLSNILEPFIPFSCNHIRSTLKLKEGSWSFITIREQQPIGKVSLIFERIDKKVIDEEVKRLTNGKA